MNCSILCYHTFYYLSVIVLVIVRQSDIYLHDVECVEGRWLRKIKSFLVSFSLLE